MTIQVFGIRHHGPGCARSLRAALTAMQPDILLVEGPPDAADVLPLITHKQLHPPVAILVYDQEEPRNASFYPFADYSPEWQALRYAAEQQIPARFIDLPISMRLWQARQAAAEENVPAADPADNGTRNRSTTTQPVEQLAPPTELDPVVSIEDDPIGALAEAAGYGDRELWWEDQIERRTDPTNLFEGIFEAMSALRAEVPAAKGEDARREAHMRQAIRAAEREGFTRIAVVCGAWHAPALVNYSSASADAATLAGIKKVKVAATWVPWTNERLAMRSGYGAGVRSPGWYNHLWRTHDHYTIRWVARAARELRKEDLAAPSSNVIEAVRLADTLAALRDRPRPGLDELREAIQTTICHGAPEPMELIRARLEIGNRLGRVPDETPAVPLQHDLEVSQRRLRLRPTTEIRTIRLDLREENDRERSHLFHRLNALAIPWATLSRSGGAKSTFAEEWEVAWKPELAISVIEASVWGNTIPLAAQAKLVHLGRESENLAQLTAMLDSAVLAQLPDAITELLHAVHDAAAVAADVRGLMNALPPLARVARYGNVRETKADDLLPIINSLVERIVVGLPGACGSLDDDAAESMVASLDPAQESIALLDQPELLPDWYGMLEKLARGQNIHGMVRGRAARILLDERQIDDTTLGTLARLTLNTATEPKEAAAWISGVVHGSGMVLLHQEALWIALDGWLTELDGEQFVAIVPLLRRAFAEFAPPERRAMGDRVRKLTQGGADQHQIGAIWDTQIDRQRADLVLPVLAQLLGVARPVTTQREEEQSAS